MIPATDSVLRDKSNEFAKQVVILCRSIKQEHRQSVAILPKYRKYSIYFFLLLID